MKGKMHPTLIELWIGILLWSVLIGAAGIWFCENKPAWIYGMVFGDVVSMGLAFYMHRSVAGLVDDLEEGRGDKRIRASSMIRLVAAGAAIAIACVVPFLNPIGTFLGIFSMKMGAYTNPLIHGITKRIHPYFKDKEYPPEEEESESIDTTNDTNESASEGNATDEMAVTELVNNVLTNRDSALKTEDLT